MLLFYFSALSGRFVANFQLPTNLITTACDVVIFCIQHDKDENDARREAGLWATEILHSCGEYLSCHLRKPVIFLFKTCYIQIN